MVGEYFYHSSIRRFVAVFGSLFNDIKVIHQNGAQQRVPLSYGPKDKFLARLDEQVDLEAPKVAIKLPRMSFEILNMTYDTQSKLNRNNRIIVDESVLYTYAPYNISMSLSIMAKTQDDALQIIEQIIPYFQPEYTVTIKEGVSDLLKTDIPITLNSIDMTEDYEGDFMNRRAIIYTLSFDAKVRFYGPVLRTGVIKKVSVRTIDTENTNNRYMRQTTAVSPSSAQASEDYEIIEDTNYLDVSYVLSLRLFPGTYGGNLVNYVAGETVTGANSKIKAKVLSWNPISEVINLVDFDGTEFSINETLLGSTTNAARLIEQFI